MYELGLKEGRASMVESCEEVVKKEFEGFRLEDWSGEVEVEDEIKRLKTLILQALNNKETKE